MELVRVWAAAADLLLGARCPGCGEPWWGVCPGCRSALLAEEPRRTRPDPTPPGFPTTVASGPYDERHRGLITAHKEEQALQLTPLLGRLLAQSVARLLLDTGGVDDRGPLVLVPVPSATAALRRRGFDAGMALARTAATVLRPAVGPVLVRRELGQRRGMLDQAGLGAAARSANLSGSLQLRSGRAPDGLRVVVDDVVTTGASLTEAVRTLVAAGRPVLGAATIAATQRRARAPREGLRSG